jgi:ribosomal protein S8
MNKIEQLIEKRTKAEWIVAKSWYMLQEEFIKDLKYLQDTTEEKPTVATVLAYEQWYKEALSEVASILKKEKCVWVPYRNWIERWIEVAEELLANSV